ncbi:MAG: helix-turn-helix domain-containing protein [Tepidisphaeraceae bacterium]|jgi:excisionase family DNA binding protein
MPIAEITTQLMTPEQTAAMLAVKTQTLALWRCSGRHNLPFLKVGSKIRYRKSAVETWLEQRTATSTATQA